MVVGAAAEPAVVVPDPGAWAMWGVDVAAEGLEPRAAPAAASILAAPRIVPHGLAAAVRTAWAELAPPRRLIELDGPRTTGAPAAELVVGERGEERHSQSQSTGHEHGGHGHGDMMEITGEPSRDGLVMESIEFEHGPLAYGLPAGLSLEVDLDGDVVCSCRVRSLLSNKLGIPDPLSAAAWEQAGRGEAGEARSAFRGVASVERERALSHLVWLSSFGTILGWQELSASAWRAAMPLIGNATDGLKPAAARATRLLSTLEPSRRLRSRCRGRGVITREVARRRGLAGPNARASGLVADARSEDARYRELGFAIRTHDRGDVEARVVQRAVEAVDSLSLASAALAREAETVGGTPHQVEGPRGPLSHEARRAVAERASAERSLAADLAQGLEWASALTVVASLDISPWEVGDE